MLCTGRMGVDDERNKRQPKCAELTGENPEASGGVKENLSASPNEDVMLDHEYQTTRIM